SLEGDTKVSKTREPGRFMEPKARFTRGSGECAVRSTAHRRFAYSDCHCSRRPKPCRTGKAQGQPAGPVLSRHSDNSPSRNYRATWEVQPARARTTGLETTFPCLSALAEC